MIVFVSLESRGRGFLQLIVRGGIGRLVWQIRRCLLGGGERHLGQGLH